MAKSLELGAAARLARVGRGAPHLGVRTRENNANAIIVLMMHTCESGVVNFYDGDDARRVRVTGFSNSNHIKLFAQQHYRSLL